MQIIGPFVNMLAMRNYPRENISFKDFLKEVKKRTIDAFDNQDYMFDDLVSQVVLHRDMSRSPLFDIMFSMQDFNTRELDIHRAGFNLSPVEYETGSTKYDLGLYAMETENRLSFSFLYCTDLFEEAAIKIFADYLIHIISDLLKNPGKKLSEVKISSEFAPGELECIQEDELESE